MRLLFAALAMLCSSLALAQQSDDAAPLTDEQKQFITESVNAFSRCSAYYEVTAQMQKETGQPASGESWHQMANGAHSSAMYLLRTEQLAAGKDAKPFTEYAPYVDGIADTARVRMLALIEAHDAETILAEMKKCSAMAPLQEELVQAMRDEIAGR